MDRCVRLAGLLIDLEAELRNRRLWDAEAPDPLALASTQPFCIDTLSFPRWLQFVFLPRMRAMVAAGDALSQQCAIAEMAEMHFAGGDGAAIVALLRRIDLVVTGAGSVAESKDGGAPPPTDSIP